MNKLAYLAAMAVLSGGLLFAQSSTTGTASGKASSSPGEIQNGTTSPMPVPSHKSGGARTTDNRDNTVPDTAPPSATIHDQAPGSSTGSETSSMGTTGSTPATPEAGNSGNQSGNSPSNNVPQASPDQQPNSSGTPPESSVSSGGSNNPGSSANGSSSNDMSGANPPLTSDPAANSPSTTAPTQPPQAITTHSPDAGTQMNPAALYHEMSYPAPACGNETSPPASSSVALAGITGMGSLAAGMLFRR